MESYCKKNIRFQGKTYRSNPRKTRQASKYKKSVQIGVRKSQDIRVYQNRDRPRISGWTYLIWGGRADLIEAQ